MTEQQKTIKKLENIKRDLFGHIEELDSTFFECTMCGRRTFTSRVESLLKKNFINMLSQIDRDIFNLAKSKDNHDAGEDE